MIEQKKEIMVVNVKKEYEVALKGTKYAKVVVASSVAHAKKVVYGYLKKRYPTRPINPDKDLVARLIKVYKDDKVVGYYKKSANVFVGRRG